MINVRDCGALNLCGLKRSEFCEFSRRHRPEEHQSCLSGCHIKGDRMSTDSSQKVEAAKAEAVTMPWEKGVLEELIRLLGDPSPAVR